MCGILGATNCNLDISLFHKALQKIENRGPDYKSVLNTGCVLLGHTRLSILDLDSRSHQPFIYYHYNKKITIVFNGEIYNFRSLKEHLFNLGFSFNTESDTEVICAAFLNWGDNCFDYFEGMWAICIYYDGNLILSRDRSGKKPLFFYFKLGQIIFSSSLESVSILSNEYSINPDSIDFYFALGFVPYNYSIYNNINKVLPGEIIKFIQISKNYYELTEKKFSFLKYDFSSFNKSSVKDLIYYSIKKRLISDVPVCSLMSGGVDSTIVSSYLTKLSFNSKSYFVDFEDKVLSERFWALFLAKKNEINLFCVKLTNEDIFEAFESYYKVFEEPFADYSGIPSINIFSKISKKFKVVLTGDGGDELFYGYPHYSKKFILYYSRKYFPFLKKITFLPNYIRKFFIADINNFESTYLSNHGLVTSFVANFIDEKFNRFISKSFVKGILKYDAEFYNLPEKYLVKIDRSSMWSGIEVRSPFMDEILRKKMALINPIFLFTPFLPKLYLKIIYFKLFGFKYLFSKKKGFTPPIQVLREKYFNKNDFESLKFKLQELSSGLEPFVRHLTFEQLVKDKILFDRFFFFDQWLKNYAINKK